MRGGETRRRRTKRPNRMSVHRLLWQSNRIGTKLVVIEEVLVAPARGQKRAGRQVWPSDARSFRRDADHESKRQSARQAELPRPSFQAAILASGETEPPSKLARALQPMQPQANLHYTATALGRPSPAQVVLVKQLSQIRIPDTPISGKCGLEGGYFIGEA
jgi:hypothetical protein